jgi:hypothetical protein
MEPDYGTAGIVPGTTFQVDPSSAFPVAGDTGELAGTGAGQYGVTPVLARGGTVSHGVLGVWNWLNTPFKMPLSPITVALLVGVVMISIIAWNLILYHIRIAGEAL